MKLKHRAINKDTREHINEPLEYDHHTYLELSKEVDMSDIKNDDNMNKNKVIDVLERELKHSKEKLKKSEEEKEALMKLLDQQQRLSLQANQKIEILEHKEQEIEEKNKTKWYHIFKRKK